ncbi:MAG: 16S rRNA methyltransferase [Chloroflexi bacterium]|nr:16S rRNA methyltransferase [Chloroflexota bacterium]
MAKDHSQLNLLVKQILASSKYRNIAPGLVRRIGTQELNKRPSLKAAIKATKNKLHQVGGAYRRSRFDYEKGVELLRETAVSPQAFRATCQTLMRSHASTRERIPILDDFYQAILADLPPIRTVLDVACGLNPLTWPWMPFAMETEYIAVDIYADMLNFIAEFFAIAGVNGRIQQRDVIGNPPTEPADLILLLKTLPCLEQVDKSAAANLIDSLNGRYLLISYPAQSLGGRSKGMVDNYTQQFEQLANGRSWQVQRFQFATELAFLVKTEDIDSGGSAFYRLS